MRLLRAGALVFVLLSAVRLHYSRSEIIGDSADWYNGQAKVTAGSDPIMLVWAAAGVLLFGLFMRSGAKPAITRAPSMKRRAVAFIIDFWFSLVTIASIEGLIPLWLEAQRTGHFSWTYARDYAVSSDLTVGIPTTLALLALLVCYFAFPLTRGRPTVGCFIMRLRVTPPFGDEGRFTFPDALRRTFYEFRGLCTSVWQGYDIDGLGRTWYDRETDTRVVLISDD